MEIGPDKTKNDKQPRWISKTDSDKRLQLEEVNLGSVISIEGSKPEILSRTAKTTAALSQTYI